MLRHAATEANLHHRYEGRQTDAPLCAQGLGQCAQAGVFERINKVYCSPMRRALQTAQRCFAKAQIVQVAGLEEFDFGIFEGRTPAQMEQDEQYRAWVRSGCIAPCPGGDVLQDYAKNTSQTVANLLQYAAQKEERTVVVVAHGGTIMATFSQLLQDAQQGSYFDWHAPNCGGFCADVLEADAVMRLQNPRSFDPSTLKQAL